MNLSYVAGFVCAYDFPELYTKYFTSLAIVLCIALLIYVLGIRRIKATVTRRVLLGILLLVALVGGHYLYQLMISGDFFGCGIFPWTAHPNPSEI